MRRYLAVVCRDLTSPFREWSWRGVGVFLMVCALGLAVGFVAVFVVGAPWYLLLRYALDYQHNRAVELTMAWLMVTWVAIAYVVSVVDRARDDRKER